MNDEARLNDIAKRLGARAADRLDVEATARRVVERLREQPVERRPSWMQPAWLRIAAVLAIVVGGAIGLRQVWPGTEVAVHEGVAHLVADELSDLSADQLRDVLTGLDTLLVEGAPDESADFDELDAQQLRSVLQTLEG